MVERSRFNPKAGRSVGNDAKIALRRKIKTIKVQEKFHHDVERHFKSIVRNAEEGIEGQVVSIAAPTATGKSHHLKRFCSQEMFEAFEDEEGTVRPLVAVSAPAPCTLRTLGTVLHEYMVGIPPKRSLRETEIWTRVAAQLRGQRTSFLVIDEMHHVLIGRSSEERVKIASTLKGLLVLDKWPINVVIAGMPHLKKFVESHHELRRRTRHCEVTPVPDGPVGNEQIAKFVSIIEGKLPDGFGFALSGDDMPERFRKATQGYLGRTAMLLKLAAVRAVEAGSNELRIKHLADEFEDIFRCSPKKQSLPRP